MTAKRLGIALLILLLAALMLTALASGLRSSSRSTGQGAVPASDVRLLLATPDVHLQPEHRIQVQVQVSNTGNAAVQAWALDLGKVFYLLEAQPPEVIYHKGHAQSRHGNVLVYANPIEPGESFEIDLILRLLFDSEGNFDADPVLKLFYAGGVWDLRTGNVTDPQKFQDVFLNFPSAEASMHILP